MKPYYDRDGITIYYSDNKKVLPLLPRADLIISDPFYEQADESDIAELDQMYQDNSPDGALVWFSKMPHTGKIQVVTELYFDFICEYIWQHDNSPGAFRSKYLPLIHHHNILVFTNNKSLIHLDDVRVKSNGMNQKKDYCVQKNSTARSRYHYMKSPYIWERNKDGNHISSVITLLKDSNRKISDVGIPVGVKPVELVEILIKGYSRQSDLVIDPFMGSGSIAVACKKLGRKYIGIEIREDYCKLAIQRLRQEIIGIIK